MRVFIGSSREATNVLDWVATQIEELGHEAEPWTKPGLFLPGTYVLPELIKIVHTSGAAIFIFAEDDRVWYREDRLRQTRDNVLLEYGLFTGVLGPDKAIICRHGNPKTPVDAQGITCIDVSESHRHRARIELREWLAKLAGEPGAVDAISVSTRQVIEAILALAIRFLSGAGKGSIVRGMCHALEGTRSLRPIAHYFPGTMNPDLELLIPCDKKSAKFIRIVEAAMTPGIVKKNVMEADRSLWPEHMRHRVRRDIASVVASPLIGRQGQVLGTVAFDSNLALDEMRWDEHEVDEFLEWAARAIVLVLRAQPQH